MPVKAILIETNDDGELLDPPRWLVQWGNVGPGYMEPTSVLYDDESPAAHVVENRVRAGLLRRDDCVATRTDAVALVTRMLEARVAH